MAGLKNALQLRQTQSQTLTMTPQLQQAIRLLQLSSIELRQEIALNLEQNPLLEINEDLINPNVESLDALIENERKESEVFDPFDNDSSINNTADISLSNEIELSEDGNHAHDSLSNLDDNGSIQELAHIKTPTSSTSVKKSMSFADDDFSVYEGETSETLQDHLMWQLDLSPLTGLDRAIAESIIDGIDDSGYLTESLDDIKEAVQKAGFEVSPEDIQAVLKIVQNYDPLGVASRSVQECLLIQLNALPKNTEYLELAKKMVKDYIDLLSNRDFRQLCQKLGVKEPILKEIMDLVTSLNPRPGQGVIKEKSDFVIPDVLAFKRKDGSWAVELNPNTIPPIRLNEQYKSLVNFAKTEQERQFFKSHLQEANWFLTSLNKRNETLLKVAQCIVDHQQDFLNEGETAMHPLILNDVASEVEMHESTISRVTTEKYLHTPRGTYELRYFFSSHVNTDDGGTASATAIRAKIKELVAGENPRKPLSDNAIADLLQEQGIMVARRTIAKYRKSLGITSSSQRKRLV